MPCSFLVRPFALGGPPRGLLRSSLQRGTSSSTTESRRSEPFEGDAFRAVHQSMAKTCESSFAPSKYQSQSRRGDDHPLPEIDPAKRGGERDGSRVHRTRLPSRSNPSPPLLIPIAMGLAPIGAGYAGASPFDGPSELLRTWAPGGGRGGWSELEWQHHERSTARKPRGRRASRTPWTPEPA